MCELERRERGMTVRENERKRVRESFEPSERQHRAVCEERFHGLINTLYLGSWRVL